MFTIYSSSYGAIQPVTKESLEQAFQDLMSSEALEGINLDITNIVALQNSINQMTSESAAPPVKEIFSNNVSDILDMLIKEYFSEHPVPVDKMTKQDMCNLIRFLDSKGAFLIRNSAPKVCSLLKISKFTLYSYLKEVNEAAA